MYINLINSESPCRLRKRFLFARMPYICKKSAIVNERNQMKFIFIQTGKTTERHIADGVSVYADRIKKLVGFEIVTLRGVRNARHLPPDEVMKREARQLLEYLSDDHYVILLDEKGREFNTAGLAVFFSRSLAGLRRKIVFVTGGAWGFAPEIYSRADMKLSLSRLTFPHQLVRLLFMEQLYRVLTIIEGIPYHHE